MKVSVPQLHLIDPHSGDPLKFTPLDNGNRQTGKSNRMLATGTWQAGTGQVWPQIDGIPFLRARRESLADEAVDLLRAGHHVEALALLLTDTDDFAATAPTREAAGEVVRDVETGCCSAIEAMRRLAYGPVADYFALRPSTPTYLSGIALMAGHVAAQDTVVELACGLGHFLNHLSRHEIACAGCDVTFSKVWLGRHFLLPVEVPLFCADIIAADYLPIKRSERCTVLCHDAFYFLQDKRRAAERMQSLAKPSGQVLLGHVHLANFDHGGIAGELLDAEGYADLFESVRHLYDDAALVREYTSGRSVAPVKPGTLRGCEALALVAGCASDQPSYRALLREPEGEVLYANPLLIAEVPAVNSNAAEHGNQGCVQPNWPSQAFASEYSDAYYLGGVPAPDINALPRASSHLDIELQTARLGLPAAFVEIATRPLRWAIVGCGWVARDYVVPAFAHTPSAALIALCDIDSDKLAQCLPATGRVPKCYNNYGEMLATESFDAIYIATPNHAHADLCIAAAESGRHVFCEKPIATTLGDARAMLSACEHAGVAYATAFDQRFHEAHHVLREAVRENKLGRITQARIHYACQVDASWQPGILDTDNWRLDRRRAGGGAVIDLAPHALDLLAFVLDDEPHKLDIKLQERLVGGVDDVDAGGVLSVSFAAGTLASIHVSYQCPEFLPRREIELIGTRGGARALETMGQTPGGRIEWRKAEGVDVQNFSTNAALSPFARQIEAFSATRINQQPWPFSPSRDLAHFKLLLDSLKQAECA